MLKTACSDPIPAIPSQGENRGITCAIIYTELLDVFTIANRERKADSEGKLGKRAQAEGDGLGRLVHEWLVCRLFVSLSFVYLALLFYFF